MRLCALLNEMARGEEDPHNGVPAHALICELVEQENVPSFDNTVQQLTMDFGLGCSVPGMGSKSARYQ